MDITGGSNMLSFFFGILGIFNESPPEPGSEIDHKEVILSSFDAWYNHNQAG